MKVTLDGRIGVLDKVPFISKLDCDTGFVLFNEKGEHFVFAIDTSQRCCECFEYDLPTIRSEKMNGCTIEVTREFDEDTLKYLELEGFSYTNYQSQEVIAIIITDNATNGKYYGYVSNDHNGYYAHSVTYGANGELEWDCL